MEEKEKLWDDRLKIKTTGRDDTNADQYRHPYEPTPYCVLERLADSGLIGREDVVLDYGCGKGRVGFFLSHQTKTKVIEFVLTRAEEYQVPQEVNRCYFFNPFSMEILHKVMARILDSYYEAPREIYLFFYYPSDEYISYLMTVEELEFYDEIICDDLFAGGDPRERIIIFSLPDYKM